MKSLQTQYNLIKEGKGNKEVFVKSAKAQFPAIPNHYGFNETVNELKHKNILNETMLGIVSAQPTTPDWFKIFNESITEAKAEEKKPTKEVVDMETRGFDYKDKKNIDNVYGEEFLKGFYTEMNDPKNKDKTVEELKEIVAKNLAKDQLHYVKDGQFGTKGVGYTTEHPGLGTPKEAKGKYKSSGYGDLKENKSIKEIGMFHDPVGYDKNAKSQIEVAREILTNAGLSKDEIDDFISNNMFKKGRLDDKAREFVNLKENQIQFEVGDEVTYLGNPGVITGINKEMTGDITYNVDYDKGEGRTTVTNVWFKSGDIEPLNGENEFSNINESKLRSAIRQFIKEELVGEVDSRFKEMQKEPHDHKWVQIDKDGTQECKICGLRRSNSFFKNRRIGFDQYRNPMGLKSSGMTAEDAMEYAQKISEKEGVVQHVNELPDGSYEVSDWYDSDSTVISFEDGREL